MPGTSRTPKARAATVRPARTAKRGKPDAGRKAKPVTRGKVDRKAERAGRALAIADGLHALYPDATCELQFGTPFQLLVATILSAQCTDKVVNTVTPALFARFPDARAMAAADTTDIEPLIARTGFFRQKAKNILGSARALVAEHGGEVPRSMEALIKLPGVARKTANVVLGTAFGMNEGIAVDTHVTRLAGRLGLSRHDEPPKIEQDLLALFPRDRWTLLGHQIIWHGRRVCHARGPDCPACTLSPMCPSSTAGASRSKGGG